MYQNLQDINFFFWFSIQFEYVLRLFKTYFSINLHFRHKYKRLINFDVQKHDHHMIYYYPALQAMIRNLVGKIGSDIVWWCQFYKPSVYLKVWVQIHMYTNLSLVGWFYVSTLILQTDVIFSILGESTKIGLNVQTLFSFSRMSQSLKKV